MIYFNCIKMREYHQTYLLGYHAVSLAHLELVIFSHSYLQKLSSYTENIDVLLFSGLGSGWATQGHVEDLS